MFKNGERAAVAGAFRLAGYEGELRTLQVDDPTERWFVLAQEELARLRNVSVLEQIVGKVLGCKVAVLQDRDGLGPYLAFE